MQLIYIGVMLSPRELGRERVSFDLHSDSAAKFADLGFYGLGFHAEHFVKETSSVGEMRYACGEMPFAVDESVGSFVNGFGMFGRGEYKDVGEYIVAVHRPGVAQRTEIGVYDKFFAEKLFAIRPLGVSAHGEHVKLV